MRDLFWILVIIGLPFGLIVALANTLNKADCEYYSEMTGYKTQYTFMHGCYVQKDSKWYDKKELIKLHD